MERRPHPRDMALEREATRRLRLAVLLLLATASCSLVSVEEQLPPATLELLARWRSLEDPADLAGVRIEVTGAGPTQVYTASDFMRSRTGSFPVPDTGQATVAVQVRQGGETVAQGSVSWYLRGPRMDLGAQDHTRSSRKRSVPGARGLQRERVSGEHALSVRALSRTVLPWHLALRGARGGRAV